MKEKLTKFLEIAKRIREPVLIYSPSVSRDKILEEIKNYFPEKKISILPISKDAKIIRETFEQSLAEGTLLFVAIDASTMPDVYQLVEQLCEDGTLTVYRDNQWQKANVHPQWRMIVYVDSLKVDIEKSGLKSLFFFKLYLQ